MAQYLGNVPLLVSPAWLNRLGKVTFVINYQNNSIKESANTKFCKLELDKLINLKKNVNKCLPKLSSACCVRSVYYYSNMSTLKLVIVHTFILEWSMALYFGLFR
jgi:hypothetical protein